MALVEAERRALEDLARLARRAARRRSRAALSGPELERLARLYRQASSLHARLESAGDDPRGLEELRGVLAAAHGVLYRPLERDPRPFPARLAQLLLVRSPRALRAEWRMLLLVFGLFYGFVALSWIAVARDLGLAFSLFDAGAVAHQIEQLEALAPGESYRGNFTFGLGESSAVSGGVMANNLGVSVLFFASGLVPPLFLFVLATNGLMVGTYTAVAGHYGQAGSISATLWCHGALELQAIVLAGAAGLVLVRGWLAPGPWSRSEALRRGAGRALEILAPALAMLVAAGLIEGYVTPHAPLETRLFVALSTGGAFLAWLLLAGRRPLDAQSPPAPGS